jgi:NAD(P)H-hydrate epimerase
MDSKKIPAITTDQMREVDRLMVENYQIELLQMMENAGRNLADLSRKLFLNSTPTGKRVLVLAGSGGNGGGGLVAARRLWNWGVGIQVILTRSAEELHGVPAHQLSILKKMGVPIHFVEGLGSLPNTDLLLDCLIGYSLKGAPRGMLADLITRVNVRSSTGVPVLSLDVPSGLDATTGQAHTPCVRATATMTLALPKIGLLKKQARFYVGDLYLADISVPPELYRSLGIQLPPIFSKQEVIPIS